MFSFFSKSNDPDYWIRRAIEAASAGNIDDLLTYVENAREAAVKKFSDSSDTPSEIRSLVRIPFSGYMGLILTSLSADNITLLARRISARKIEPSLYFPISTQFLPGRAYPTAIRWNHNTLFSESNIVDILVLAPPNLPLLQHLMSVIIIDYPALAIPAFKKFDFSDVAPTHSIAHIMEWIDLAYANNIDPLTDFLWSKHKDLLNAHFKTIQPYLKAEVFRGNIEGIKLWLKYGIKTSRKETFANELLQNLIAFPGHYMEQHGSMAGYTEMLLLLASHANLQASGPTYGICLSPHFPGVRTTPGTLYLFLGGDVLFYQYIHPFPLHTRLPLRLAGTLTADDGIDVEALTRMLRLLNPTIRPVLTKTDISTILIAIARQNTFADADAGAGAGAGVNLGSILPSLFLAPGLQSLAPTSLVEAHLPGAGTDIFTFTTPGATARAPRYAFLAARDTATPEVVASLMGNSAWYRRGPAVVAMAATAFAPTAPEREGATTISDGSGLSCP